MAERERTRAALIEARREFVVPALRPYYEEPLVLESGRGSRVRDMDGREFLERSSENGRSVEWVDGGSERHPGHTVKV